MGMLNRSQRCLKLSSHLEQLLLVQVTFFMGVALQKGFFKSLKNSLFRYDPGEGYTLAYHPRRNYFMLLFLRFLSSTLSVLAATPIALTEQSTSSTNAAEQ